VSFSRRNPWVTYSGGGEYPGVIGQEGHLRTVKALLVEDPLLEYDRRFGIVVKPGVVITGITLRLRSRAAYRLDPSPPPLFGQSEDPIMKILG
jgi:hypothetical protein